MTIQTIRFGGVEYSLETLGNLTGPELVKLHNNCASLAGIPETKRFSDKSSALKRTWAVLLAYNAQNKKSDHVVSSTGADVSVEDFTNPALLEQLPKIGDATASSEPSATADKHSEESKVAAAKKKVPAKSAKKAAEEHAVTRGFAEDAKIKVLVKENPRRGAAAERFELYKTGMTVAEYTKKIGSRSEALVHLRWDVNKGHISVG